MPTFLKSRVHLALMSDPDAPHPLDFSHLHMRAGPIHTRVAWVGALVQYPRGVRSQCARRYPKRVGAGHLPPGWGQMTK